MKDDNRMPGELFKTVAFEQSEVPVFAPPLQNQWEKDRWNSDGYDQLGAKKK